MQKVSSIVDQWDKRDLSFCGKITIINTLCNSQFMYKLQCLPTPPEHVLKCYKKKITEFIWSGRKSKIKYDRLIQEWEEGGMKLQDLALKDKSLKIAAYLRYMNSENTLAKHYLKNITGMPDSMFLDHNVSLSDASKKCREVTFLSQAFRYWSEISYHKPYTKGAILQQAIWHNSNLKVANEPISTCQDCIMSILRIKDLCAEDMRSIMSYKQVIEKYGKIKGYNFMIHNSIIAAMPKEWVRIIKIDDNCNGSYKLFKQLILTNNKMTMSAFVYKHLLKQTPKEYDKSRYKWECNLDYEINDVAWKRIMLETKTLTASMRLHTFQYRLNNHAITTNLQLERYGIVNSNLCSFCRTEPETVTHMLTKCPKVLKKVWYPLRK